MTNIFEKFSFVTASTVISLSLINANPSHAALITYDFDVDIDSGSLVGEIYSGFVEFDDSGLTGIAEEFLSVSQISFDFLGVNYTETDGLSDPEVAFLDGSFLGLSFSTDEAFSFVPGFFDLSEAFFAYDTPGEGEGTGDITYTLAQSTPIPEPLTMLGSVTALGFGVLFKKKRSQKNK